MVIHFEQTIRIWQVLKNCKKKTYRSLALTASKSLVVGGKFMIDSLSF